MSNRPLRLLSLFARHGTSRYTGALDRLRARYSRQLPGVDHEILVIDNALEPGTFLVEQGITVIGGDNEAWEFTAWDRGVAHVGPRLASFDVVCLVTSALEQLSPHHLEYLCPQMLHVVAGRARALGHIDRRTIPATLLGSAASHWIRTSFVVLPPQELQLLGPLTTITSGARFFSGHPGDPFRPDAPLSPQLRRDIVSWLCGDGLGQGVTWHSRFSLSAETLPFFERKATAILNEQALSSRLVAQGCQLVDMTWLGSRVCNDDLPALLPSWRAQLAARNRDAIARGTCASDQGC